ncbi:MAG: hypothetical protein JOY59_11770, partial [Candidatus Eremiobacteraeota bacterium]|nr:hypothetical protein [Candidatus Eremiobacteraeota bacterium]
MAVRFTIPSTSSMKSLHPKYVSPFTLGASITTYPALAAAPAIPTLVTDLSSGSPACSAPNGQTNADGSRTCNVSVQAAVGNDFFTINTFDAHPNFGSGSPPPPPQVQGNLLATATVQYNVVSGTTNTVPITMAGVPASIVLIPAPGVLVPTNGSSSFAMTVNAKDADGNYILGAGQSFPPTIPPAPTPTPAGATPTPTPAPPAFYSQPITLSTMNDPHNVLSFTLPGVCNFCTILTVSASSTVVTVNVSGPASLPASAPFATITANAPTTSGSATTQTVTPGSLLVAPNSSSSQVSVLVPNFTSSAVWVSDPFGANQLLHYAANASGPSVTPIQTLVAGLHAFSVALDSSGNMYVANGNNGVTFYPAPLTNSSTPTRSINICGANSVTVQGTNLYVDGNYCGTTYVPNAVMVFPTN